MKKIVVLTGAGVSAESGVPTFRDGGGLWENHRVEDVADIQGWYRDPALVVEFYNGLRHSLGKVAPNAAHLALAELEKKYEVVVITQNVDDLHERAGSSHVIHLHGELTKICSSLNKESHISQIGYDDEIHMGDLAEDGSQLRPYIVWFGEAVPNIEPAFKEVASADIFIVIGTSLQVQPAASLVMASRAEQNYIIDLGTPKMVEEISSKIQVLQTTATEGMRKLLEIL